MRPDTIRHAAVQQAGERHFVYLPKIVQEALNGVEKKRDYIQFTIKATGEILITKQPRPSKTR